MKIDLITPSSPTRAAQGAVEFTVRVINENGQPAPGVELVWSVSGSPSKFHQRSTMTDRGGNATNRLLLSGDGDSEGGFVFVRTVKGLTRMLGVLQTSKQVAGLQGMFIPNPRGSVQAPAPAVAASGKNVRNRDAGFQILPPPEQPLYLYKPTRSP